MKQMNNDEKGFFADFFGTLFGYVKKNWKKILVFSLTFLFTVALIYLDANTSENVASYAIGEYEVGQIADRTIYATKSLQADEYFPISIEEGEKVIRKGFPITEEDFLKLRKMSSSPNYIDYRAFADKILYLMLLASLCILFYSPVLINRVVELKEVVLESILFLIVFSFATFGDKSAFFQSIYALPVIIPSALCVGLVAILFGQISAVFFSIIISMGILCAANFELVPFLFTLASTLTFTRIVRNIEHRIDMVFSSIGLAVFNVIYIVTLKVIFNDNFIDAIFILPGIAFNGFLSGILVLGLLTPLEAILNTASVFRLMDLSDHQNTPMLRKLFLTAPGTYQHSLMVGQLAESACNKIGANALLARVASYYHDIGKIEHPEYFTENNIESENKHTDLNPSLSVSVIKSHVRLGVEKARQMYLPKQVTDIIVEHHGNGVITFFYNAAKEKDPSVSIEDYKYDGNPPTTKESAVVMLADSVEAACKTLDKPTAQRLEKFIQQIINSKIESHQLDDCALTFGELTKIKEAFVDILAAYYHGRIKYQNQKDPDEEKNDLSDDESNSMGEKNE